MIQDSGFFNKELAGATLESFRPQNEYDNDF